MNEIGGASIAHGGDEKCIQNCYWKALGMRPLENLGIDGKIILKWVLGNKFGGCGLDSPGLGGGLYWLRHRLPV